VRLQRDPVPLRSKAGRFIVACVVLFVADLALAIISFGTCDYSCPGWHEWMNTIIVVVGAVLMGVVVLLIILLVLLTAAAWGGRRRREPSS
jgi:multisubunit Na+/H+ antiporter MnhB subunit